MSLYVEERKEKGNEVSDMNREMEDSERSKLLEAEKQRPNRCAFLTVLTSFCSIL